MATSREANLRQEAAIAIAGALAPEAIVSGLTYSNTTHLITFALQSLPGTWSVGQTVIVSGVAPAAYNGSYEITALSKGGNTFQAAGSNNGAFVSGGGATSRAQLGLVDEPGAADFFAELLCSEVGNALNGLGNPFFCVLPAKNTRWNGQNRHFDIVIPIRAWFAAAGDGSPDFTDFEDIWTAARNALRGTTYAWQRSPPDELSIDGPNLVRSDLKPMVFAYDFELVFPA